MAWQEFIFYNQPLESPLDSPSHPTNSSHLEFVSFSSQCFSIEPIPNRIQHRESISSIGSSTSRSASSTRSRQSTTTTDLTTFDSDTDAGPASSDEPWNLVVDNIPWGPEYEGYDTGTLPGPDGACVFLRSPTPLKGRRTSRACDTCRNRKAKCSGARPSCARCLSHGMLCLYGLSTDVPSISSRTSLRRQSHPGSSGLKLPFLKLSTRNRLGRRASLADTPVGESLPSTSSELNDATSFPTLFNDPPTTLNDESSKYLTHCADFESPVEPVTPPLVPSHQSNPSSYNFSAMMRGRDPSSSDSTSALLYMEPLSSLDEYRFPADQSQSCNTTLQHSSHIPSFPPLSHHSSIMDSPGDSSLSADIRFSSEIDALCHDLGFFDPIAFPGDLFDAAFTNVKNPIMQDLKDVDLLTVSYSA